jgi:7-carboxy-7-deazaguanine synthase
MSSTHLKINEIFRSIQGESTWAGMPCIFVRLQGCPLRCRYCDTSYAFREGYNFRVEEVLQEVKKLKLNLVQITGGEPLVQEAVFDLINLLCEVGMTVLVETSGAYDLVHCDPRANLIVDIKTPHSGAADSFLESNYDCLSDIDQVKFVITNREDFEWAVKLTEDKNLRDLASVIHFSPAMPQDKNVEVEGFEGLDPSVLADWIMEDAPWARMHLQLHKYIWPSSMRGV